MPFLWFVVVPVICFLLAIVIGRWWVLLVPVAAWVLSFVGWGGVVGDGWYFAMLGHIGVGVAVVAVGLALRLLFDRAGWLHRAPTQTR